MAIEQGIWRLGDVLQKLRPARLADESLLEEQIMQDSSILNREWLLIGRQVRTAFDKLIDLLAIDANGSVIIIELKRDKTPRDVVAQAIDYASWIANLQDYQLIDIYQDFARTHSRPHETLGEAFYDKFDAKLDDVALNGGHQMVVVASHLDASTERIINYLNEYGQIAINALFFAAFEDGGNHYLSRAWMIDPDEPAQSHPQKRREPWNGEFYASFGNDRPWDLARSYGFIPGGGAAWYSKTLSMLSEGDRVWVNIPKTGYVGVGIVTGERCRADLYQFDTPEGPKTLIDMGHQTNYRQLQAGQEDDETAEYLVPVRWLYSVNRSEAFSEVGLFGNQNTVCKPSTPKWSHTVNRLKQVWNIS